MCNLRWEMAYKLRRLAPASHRSPGSLPAEGKRASSLKEQRAMTTLFVVFFFFFFFDGG